MPTAGWSGGAKVLGKLPVLGRPTILITVGQGPTALAVGAGGGCLDIFTLIYPFSPLSPSLWETARYRLKYCLKGPLNPKQPTNQQPTKIVCPQNIVGNTIWCGCSLLKDLTNQNLFIVTATDAVPCGGRKTSSRTSLLCRLYFLIFTAAGVLPYGGTIKGRLYFLTVWDH